MLYTLYNNQFFTLCLKNRNQYDGNNLIVCSDIVFSQYDLVDISKTTQLNILKVFDDKRLILLKIHPFKSCESFSTHT